MYDVTVWRIAEDISSEFQENFRLRRQENGSTSKMVFQHPRSLRVPKVFFIGSTDFPPFFGLIYVRFSVAKPRFAHKRMYVSWCPVPKPGSGWSKKNQRISLVDLRSTQVDSNSFQPKYSKYSSINRRSVEDRYCAVW
jgi:hypothetical protein